MGTIVKTGETRFYGEIRGAEQFYPATQSLRRDLCVTSREEQTKKLSLVFDHRITYQTVRKLDSYFHTEILQKKSSYYGLLILIVIRANFYVYVIIKFSKLPIRVQHIRFTLNFE